jgi:hypothetical protein
MILQSAIYLSASHCIFINVQLLYSKIRWRQNVLSLNEQEELECFFIFETYFLEPALKSCSFVICDLWRLWWSQVKQER